MKKIKSRELSVKKLVKALFIVLSGIVVITVVLVGLFFGYLSYKGHQDSIKETQIHKKFHEEVAKIPNFEVKSFKLWEGDSIVEIKVKDKGTVRFWYGIDGIPRIDSIDKYSTSYDCFNIDSQGNKQSYAFTKGLVLDKNSIFKQWFPFEVNTLKDLDMRYNDIIKILETFQKNLTKVEYKDNWGIRKVVGQPNSDFAVRPDKNKNDITCYLFTQSTY